MVVGGVWYGRRGLEVERMVGEGNGVDGRGWGRVGSVIFLQKSFLFFFYKCACTHAHAYVEVSQLNKFANSFGPSCPGLR